MLAGMKLLLKLPAEHECPNSQANEREKGNV
jgi:hypothetical protein